MTPDPGKADGAASCWRCGRAVTGAAIAVESVLHGRARRDGGPYRTWRCPACRTENGALAGPRGGWLLHPLEGLRAPDLVERLFAGDEAPRTAARTWWREHAARVERFRRGLDAPGAPRRGRAPGAAGQTGRARRAPARPEERPAARTGPLAVLGLPADATPDEIRRAFRRAAKRLHPDRAAGDPESQADAHRRFREVRAAYEAALRVPGGGRSRSG